ncbi:MAG: STAS domain-containing protein [Oscillospiraceae bacterium]|nr:STAS domain-containing protein [Oscillospiraceae bacterium]
MLNIRKTVEDGQGCLSLEGRLDTATAPELEKELSCLMPDVSTLTLDFAGLDYVSSAGLRVLLSAQKTMSRQGEMKLTNVNATVMEIFEVTGFSDILKIV